MSIFGSSALSDPNADTIAGIQIKRLPPGAALGAGDLQRWAHNRLLGRSSVTFGVEKTAAGWVVSLPNGKTIGGFKSRRAAWKWLKQRRSRRRGR